MPLSKQPILFVINPKAGTSNTGNTFEKSLKKFFHSEKFDPILEFTQRKGHASELVKSYLADGVKEFVAVGGDGTINEVAIELVHQDANLSLVSKGSGNGLARHLGVFGTDEYCLKIISTGKLKRIDVGVINKLPFLCTAGVGFDAYIAKLFDEASGRGLRNYIKEGLKAYRSYKGLELSFCGKERTVFSLTFGNASQFGNNAFITPEAVIDDGLIDCCLVNPHPKISALGITRQMFTKSLQHSRYTECFRESSFEVKTKDKALIHVDGEPVQLETNDLKIDILERALSVRI